MRAFTFLYQATLREFVRDKTALFWTFVFPLIFITIFGVVFSEEGAISFSIGMVNEDGAGSALLIESFQQIEAFEITQGNREDELQALEDGDRVAVIVIPEGTGRTLEKYFGALTQTGGADTSLSAPLETYYDPSSQQTSQIILSVIDQVIAEMSADMIGIPPALTIEPRSVSTDTLRFIDYLLPGILAMSLMQLGLNGTAEPLVSLREKQVLRRLGATPLTKTTLLASQVAFRLTIALLTAVLIVVVGTLMFDVHIEMSNILGIIAVIVLGSTLFITMGYFLSGLAKTEQAVQGLVALPYFIFMFLSGIFFPLDFMPAWIRPLVDAIPLTYLADALREMMIESGSYFSMTRNVVTMGIWLVVCAVLAVRFFHWEPQA